jgi:hypothetical protein
MLMTVNVGVIGVGKIGQEHIRRLTNKDLGRLDTALGPVVGYFERLKNFFEGWFSRPYMGQNGPEFIGPDPNAKGANKEGGGFLEGLGGWWRSLTAPAKGQEAPITDADRLRQAALIDTSGLRVDNTPVSTSNPVPVTIVRDDTPGGIFSGFMQWWSSTMPGFFGGSNSQGVGGGAESGLGMAQFGDGGGGTEAGDAHTYGQNKGRAAPGNTADAMRIAMNALAKEGVPSQNLRAAAALLVGEATAESSLNPRAVHDSGTGYGIYGAGHERMTAMLNWLAANGYAKDSLEGQMRYMAHEAMSGKYPRTRAALMGATPENIVGNTYGRHGGIRESAGRQSAGRLRCERLPRWAQVGCREPAEREWSIPRANGAGWRSDQAAWRSHSQTRNLRRSGFEGKPVPGRPSHRQGNRSKDWRPCSTSQAGPHCAVIPARARAQLGRDQRPAPYRVVVNLPRQQAIYGQHAHYDQHSRA